MVGAIEFPPSTGLRPVLCTTSIALRVGGDEARALAGGLDYPGAEELSGVRSSVEPALPDPGGRGCVRRVRTELPGWSLLLEYRLGDEVPRARLAFELTRFEGEDRPLRDMALELALALDPAEWLLHAPGNRLAPGTCVTDLHTELAVSPATGSLGSLGLVALSHRDHRASCCRPFSRTEIGWITLVPVPGACDSGQRPTSPATRHRPSPRLRRCELRRDSRQLA